MNNKFTLPYGKTSLTFELKSKWNPVLILPKQIHANEDAEFLVDYAIRNPLLNCGLPPLVADSTKVVITINDKTRPVPNDLLFPPLLRELHRIGVKNANITFLIATGTHVPMQENEFHLLINKNIVSQYRILSHDCDDESNLVFKGISHFSTNIYVNKVFDDADIKIVVGDIEPHHFAGFSGGAKSAAIGVCGRNTINQNHSLLLDPRCFVGNYENNPLRQDIEEIGALIGVDLALNAILNEQKVIVKVFFGKPLDVIKEGVKVIRKKAFIKIDHKFDLVIASAGGYPKDINLYQAQKALTHASLFCKNGGTVILAAACNEGVGSQSYSKFMEGVNSHQQAIDKFTKTGFSVGPHKAFQFAMIAKRVKFRLFSEIEPSTLEKLLIKPVSMMEHDIKSLLSNLSEDTRIAVIPYATATIPVIKGDSDGN
ncbi:MAG: hypothetical protein FD147_131 [Chloroflexi bacterium]|nr:MAG: hypothetical protein FD147_131 [Chloroflexota bacterium]